MPLPFLFFVTWLIDWEYIEPSPYLDFLSELRLTPEVVPICLVLTELADLEVDRLPVRGPPYLFLAA